MSTMTVARVKELIQRRESLLERLDKLAGEPVGDDEERQPPPMVLGLGKEEFGRFDAQYALSPETSTRVREIVEAEWRGEVERIEASLAACRGIDA